MSETEFEEKEREIKELTKLRLAPLYPVYWSSLGLIHLIVDLLLDEVTADEDSGDTGVKYSKATLILLSRSIQHVESVRLLLEGGMYGDCFPLTRNVMSDLSMLQYLSYHPELLDLFLLEKQNDYQTRPEFKAAFSENAIEKDLVGRGQESVSKAFQMLSKTAHASTFGAQLYWTKDHASGVHNPKYEPIFEEEKALLLGDLLLTAHLDFAAVVLRYRQRTGQPTDQWLKVEDELLVLRAKSEQLGRATLVQVNALWPSGKKRQPDKQE
ncbi:hypothetical protein KBD34_01985 [Patescibacteria group bacterium]|nr:hypothetical protein [Patescibacteria group bacterium]